MNELTRNPKGNCSAGYQGIACTACSPGYSRTQDFVCSPCGSKATSVLVLLAILIGVIIFFFVLIR